MIETVDLSARVGSFMLDHVTLTVPASAYGVVIGPAGSGKTTLLETIGGIIRPMAGAVWLDGRDVTWRPPEERNVGLVYQHGYLFPHLSVGHNVLYGAPDPVEARDTAARFQVDTMWTRAVRSLSGGERQLVALVRAIARRPAVLLLDEPFSALDPHRRSHVRREVRSMHRERGWTVLQVTHDFTEAGLLGDVAVLLDGGRVLQSGAPEDVFRKPASPYIAAFLGAENVFAGTVADVECGEAEGSELTADAPLAVSDPRYRVLEFRVTGAPLRFVAVGDASRGPGYAVLRAEEVVISRDTPDSSARNRFRGRVQDLATLGALTRVTVDVAGLPIAASLTTRSARDLALVPGADVYVSFKAMAIHLC